MGRLGLSKPKGYAYHPLLNPTNSWTWKFLPGLVIGFGLSFWMNLGNKKVQDDEPKAKAKKKQATWSGPVPSPEEELKLVMVVNEELKMTKGKIAAQCGHAVYGLTKKLRKKHLALLQQWEACGQPKIALKGDGGVSQLKALMEAAAEANIPVHVVCDAGRTQIAAGSQTVLALGPAGKTALDKVTGHLKLL